MPRSRVRGMLNFTTSMPFANTEITLIIIIIIIIITTTIMIIIIIIG